VEGFAPRRTAQNSSRRTPSWVPQGLARTERSAGQEFGWLSDFGFRFGSVHLVWYEEALHVCLFVCLFLFLVR
jgi:hypothetical protein